MARRTAASDPGSATTMRPRDEAGARRGSSSRPGRSARSSASGTARRSRRAVFRAAPSMASNVLSREVMPVPPVVMIDLRRRRSAQLPLDRRSHQVGVVLDDARPATTWPASVSRSTIARPLVSVSSVRVSLTVRTKQRSECGARRPGEQRRSWPHRRVQKDPPYLRFGPADVLVDRSCVKPKAPKLARFFLQPQLRPLVDRQRVHFLPDQGVHLVGQLDGLLRDPVPGWPGR